MHDHIRDTCDSSLTESCKQHDFFKCRLLPSTQSLRCPTLTMFGYTMAEKDSHLAVFETLAAGCSTGWLAAAYAVCQSPFYLIFIVACSKGFRVVPEKIKHPYIEEGTGVCWEVAKLSECLIAHFVFMCRFQAGGGKRRGNTVVHSVINLINIGKG